MINPLLFITFLLMAFILGIAIGCIIVLILILSQRTRKKTRYAYDKNYLRHDINSKVNDLSKNERRSVDGKSSNDNF